MFVVGSQRYRNHYLDDPFRMKFEINAETSDFIRELCVLQKVHETDESF